MAGSGEQLREQDRQHDVARGLGVAARGGAQREREQRVEVAGARRAASAGSATERSAARRCANRGAQPRVAPGR